MGVPMALKVVCIDIIHVLGGSDEQGRSHRSGESGGDGMSENRTPPVITADMRERQSQVCGYLEKSRRVVVEYVDLACGDYVCGPGVAIERKESADFVNSITDNRFFTQVHLLKSEYAHPIFLIEGDPFQTRSQIPPAALIGAISYLSVVEGISVIQTGDKKQTAQMLETMARHSQQGLGYEVALRSQKPKDASIRSRFIVEGLPSIGPKAAANLLRHFNTVARIFSATEKELCEVPGIGIKTASRIREILNYPYNR
jgi:Fanconi anemia group M protein